MFLFDSNIPTFGLLAVKGRLYGYYWGEAREAEMCLVEVPSREISKLLLPYIPSTNVPPGNQQVLL